MRRLLIGLVVPVLVIVGYAAATAGGQNPFYPPPGVIAQRFADLWLFARVSSDVVPSLLNLAAGFVIAVVAGIALGLLLGRVRLLGATFLPLVDFARSIPPIMLIPPLVLVLGIGDASKITIIALGSMFPVLVATVDGIRRIDPGYLDLAAALRLSRARAALDIWMPAAAPSIVGGIQTALQLALVLTVSSEMVAAFRGIGYLTMQAQITFDAPTVWAGIVLLGLLGVAINGLFVLARRRVLAWHDGQTAATD